MQEFCSKCGGETKFVKGISKKTGKPFQGFFCQDPECNNVDFIKSEPNITKEIREISKPIPQPIQKPPKDEFVEGKKENNRLICRTNLMCEVTRAYAQMGSINPTEIKETFNDLWKETDK